MSNEPVLAPKLPNAAKVGNLPYLNF